MIITQFHRLILFIVCSLFVCENTGLADTDKSNRIIQLWPGNPSEVAETVLPDRGDGEIRVTDINTPTMLCFPATNVSDQSAPAVILCPGGGYKYLVISKMTPIAEWLNDQGFTVFVLKYRVPKRRNDAFQDIQRALRIVRFRAQEWNLDPNRIGVMGSSAGGHLAARVSTGFEIDAYKADDAADGVSCRPDFTVLLYPAYMNKGDQLAKEFTVSRELAPTLIISAKDDRRHIQGSHVYEKALKEAGASVRFHLFETGGHGFGLRPKQFPLSTWPELCEQWFRDIGILEKSGRE